ncbi:cysteine protease StiP domain-containing protein (plasmid) [Rhizobium sp. T1473]|uniref:cysteine protease StiP domain-containing protein n=1 Tax=Rhizobium sp. T1473 TaxID=555321 RepID=UPI001AAFFAB2
MSIAALRKASDTPAGFSGSYHPDDVIFLLKPMAHKVIDIAEKEHLIQSGLCHYSEMVSQEKAPSAAYSAIYRSALDTGKERMGREVAAMAARIASDISGPITLASLVRAGVPLGILLRRALHEMDIDVAHYGVSIIRDRGIDAIALNHILNHRPGPGIVFVDGWTGKGAISTELERSLAHYRNLPLRLAVLADPCGRAWLAASGDDWLIPSGILGSTVSGLLSRSILNDEIGPDDFHGCMIWDHLAPQDVSRAFIETVWPYVRANLGEAEPSVWTEADRKRMSTAATKTIQQMAAQYEVDNPNRIKPGIAEATRAVLRRIPEKVFIASTHDRDLSAVIHLADHAGVQIEYNPTIEPYRAVTLIRKTS